VGKQIQGEKMNTWEKREKAEKRNSVIKRKKEQFVISRFVLDLAVQKYLDNGGKIKKIKPERAVYVGSNPVLTSCRSMEVDIVHVTNYC
jgi:hypothetical protein